MTTPDLTDLQLLEAAARALRSFTLRSLTVKPGLDTPYRDDPRWTPWTRWLEPEARRAHDLSRTIRKRLAEDEVLIHGPDGAVPGLWPELPAELEQIARVRALCLGQMQGTTWARMILEIIGEEAADA